MALRNPDLCPIHQPTDPAHNCVEELLRYRSTLYLCYYLGGVVLV